MALAARNTWTKSSWRSVLTLWWKMCWYMNTHVGTIRKSCLHNLYVNPAGMFNYIFPVYKLRWMKPAIRLTKRYLVYCWVTKLTSVKINKNVLHRGINTLPKFLWMCNTDYMHSICTFLIEHAICEGLHL